MCRSWIANVFHLMSNSNVYCPHESGDYLKTLMHVLFTAMLDFSVLELGSGVILCTFVRTFSGFNNTTVHPWAVVGKNKEKLDSIKLQVSISLIWVVSWKYSRS
ncbi:hypothetical protein M758_10G169100 [Ceratodon purpureus]|uniref:Uncharacterized protein n=1 Tax=Ceratodon purpureus TaxID=3225 RepID=A0A8T0GLC6_CERPU|nr:hypothetical protein KC19_10G173500 [Ceratodon purpureus]KAG0604394.1 hypothetical protein M758_10G169100 [Ceratodon purpureus]